MFKRALMLFSCALLLAVIPARADQWDKKTVVTFNTAVEVPGAVLVPGRYVFKLVESTGDRHIVQVFNEDDTKLLTTILAVPNYRLEPRDVTIMRFEERPRNAPEVLRAWFYPGDNSGQEFVYPKARAIEIAEEVMQPVLAAPLTAELNTEELAKAPVETIAPPVATVAPPVETVAPPVTEEKTSLWNVPESTGVKPETETVVEPEPAPVSRELPEIPATASEIPLIALFGAILVGAAVIMKRT